MAGTPCDPIDLPVLVPSESDEPPDAEIEEHLGEDLPADLGDCVLSSCAADDPLGGGAERLGWCGNEFSFDPQYGISPVTLFDKTAGDAPDPRETLVSICVVGDAGTHVEGPTGAGFTCRTAVFSEGEVIGHGTYIVERLRLAASGAAVKYLVLAPTGVSYLRAEGRRARPADVMALVRRGFDRDVRKYLNFAAKSLRDWRILEITPGASTYATRDQTANFWTSTRWPAARFGGRAGAVLKTRSWRWPSPPSSTPGPGRCTSASSWTHVVLNVAADFLCQDLVGIADLNAENVGTTVVEGGRVHRHALRGPAPWDPKAQKRLEDASCPAGLRDPAALATSWPELWSTMAKVCKALVAAIDADDRLSRLTECFGQSPSRSPPAPEQLREVRALVGAALGVEASACEEHGAHCLWRYRLVSAIQAQSADPDTELVSWLRDGAPMGIRSPLLAGGGIFPAKVSDRTVPPEAVLARPPLPNHPSFREGQGLEVAPGQALIQEHVERGFALLFSSRAEAERHLQSPIAAAPLGTISKFKEDGTAKHRVIMDLRANGVNEASSTPERQVLPTLFQHALDVASLSALADLQESGGEVSYMILDFKDAFMSLGLHPAERPFNACELEHDVARRRPPLYSGEPEVGKFLVMLVLGFGGKPNPLVFGRAASFACRAAQGMLRAAPGMPGCSRAAVTRLQCYVDDPIATVYGDAAARELAVDLVILLWLTLGIDLAWKKGSWTSGQHRWIGADFQKISARAAASPTDGDLTVAPPRPGCLVTAPPAFLDDLFQRLEPLATGRGHSSTQDLEALLGRGGRLAYLVPAAGPYVSALWGALAGSRAATLARRREAPPGRHANRRFAAGARWLRTLIRPPAGADLDGLLPLEHLVVVDPLVVTLAGPVVHVDASPWGAGAVLLVGGRPTEYAWCAWTPQTASRLGAPIGSPSSQTVFEYLALLLALILWGSRFRAAGLAVLGDNLASLNALLSFKGRRNLAQVTKEMAWRKARFGWRYAVGHLPSERNTLADALSRVAAPGDHSKEVPAELQAARRRAMPSQEDVWCVPP